jgi:hypothetical protein
MRLSPIWDICTGIWQIRDRQHASQLHQGRFLKPGSRAKYSAGQGHVPRLAQAAPSGLTHLCQHGGTSESRLLLRDNHVNCSNPVSQLGRCVNMFVWRESLRNCCKRKIAAGTVSKLLECKCKHVRRCSVETPSLTLLMRLSLRSKSTKLVKAEKQSDRLTRPFMLKFRSRSHTICLASIGSSCSLFPGRCNPTIAGFKHGAANRPRTCTTRHLR